MPDATKPGRPLADRREIRVFISSTFRDMQEEREDLVKQIFPQLRRLCESCGVTWGEVDLRWGVPDEAKAEGKVLPLCLQEIEHCRPYFIGLLGERYGWVPEEIPPELLETQAWLEKHRGKSVTALEILHGVLENPEMEKHAFFYFRDPAYAAAHPGFTETDPLKREKLVKLKDDIRGSGFPISEPFATPKQLGEWVLRDLTAVIEELYPEKTIPNALDRAALDHEAYSASRRTVYIGRQAYIDRLDAHAASDGPPLVIAGESGGGKSALVANWTCNWSEDHPETPVLVHFIGAVPDSANWMAMLRRLLGEFQRKFEIQIEIPDQPDALRMAFANALHMVAARGRLVLTLDALNQIEDRAGAPELVWLPPVIPANVRLIVSTLPGRSWDELKKRGWPVLTVEPLTVPEREELIDKYLKRYAKALSPEPARRIAAAPQTGNGLYLSTLLNELRQFGSYEGLNQRIDWYLEAVSPLKLYGKVLERWEQDYGKPDPACENLVRESLTRLWAARRGLSETELLESLGTAGSPLPHAFWSPLFLAAGDALVNRNGLLTFAHEFLREAVKEAYLLAESDQQAAHRALAHMFERGCKGEGDSYLQLERPIAEVAYHYRLCDDRITLKAIYANMSYLCCYVKCHSAFDLKEEIQAAPIPCIDKEVRLLIANAASLLVKYPDQAPQLLYKELTSASYRRQAERLAVRPWIRVDPIQLGSEVEDRSVGISPVVSIAMPVQASCVAAKANLAFIHNAANRIAVLKTEDMRPCGDIPLPQESRIAVRTLLCDRNGSLLALIYDSGEIEVLRTVFSPTGDILSTNSVHRGLCMTGRFGAVSACALLDEIVYQSRDGRIVSLRLDAEGHFSSSDTPACGKTLLSYFGVSAGCHAWREGNEYILSFPKSDARVCTAYRTIAVCRFENRLVVSTEENKLLTYKWPSLEIEKVLSCRLPILSISPSDHGFLLMTDRHGNILSMDSNLEVVDHGRCSNDLHDDYPSAVYSTGGGALYISNWRCVTLSIGNATQRDIMQVDGDRDHCNLLTYSRVHGFMLSIGRAAPRPLRQNVVGHQYEFEFSNFKAAWSERGTIAYSQEPECVLMEDGERSTQFATDSEIRKIMYFGALDAFLVLCRSGLLHLFSSEGMEPFSIQFPRSETGNYLMETCGEYLCVVAQNVLCQPSVSNSYLETVLSLHRLRHHRGQARNELVDVQHFNLNQPFFLGLSYHRGSNSLYLLRTGMLERWQLDQPERHNLTRIEFAMDRNVLLPFCAQGNGGFYVDTSDRLKFQPMISATRMAEITSFRTITFLSPAIDRFGFMVEDNRHLYSFTIEEE
jgi:hypothetical protein